MLTAALLGAIRPVAAQSGDEAAMVKAFPDFLKARSEFLSAAITASPEKALAFKPAYRDYPAGRVRISVERDEGAFYVLFLRERDGSYPYASKGNVIIKRDSKTGYVIRVTWYLTDDGDSWIRLTPKNERTLVDFVVRGQLVRADYPAQRLIYQLFAGDFQSLYGATKAGLDWGLLFGAPGPEGAATLVHALNRGDKSGAAGALLQAAGDFTKVGEYLALAGGAELREETAPRFARVAAIADARDPGTTAAAAWSQARGLPISALAGIFLAGWAEGSAYVALVEGTGTAPPADLAIVPYRDVSGELRTAAFDAHTGKAFDLASYASQGSQAYVRLFRLPLPSDSP